MRSVFASSQKQVADSELLRHQTQILTNSNPTEYHRDMFYGLGRQGFDLRSLYGNTAPRRNNLAQPGMAFHYSRQGQMGTIPTIHDPSKLFLEGQPRSNIERQSESAIQQAGTPALTAGAVDLNIKSLCI